MHKILKVFIFWTFGLFLLSYLGSVTFPRIQNSALGAQNGEKEYSYYLSLAQWDGGNYLTIAKNGYQKPSYYAFSPAYPTAVGALAELTKIDILICAILISVGSLLSFLYFFYRYTALIYGNKIAENSVLTFLFFPATFFCLLVYSESLFLLFTILSIYSLIKNRYLLSIITSAALPLIRFVGVFLILANIFTATTERRSAKLSVGFVLSALLLAIYLFTLFKIFNDPLFFLSTQNLWSRFPLDLVSTIFLYLVPFFSLKMLSLINLMDFAVTLIFLWLLVRGIKVLPKNLWIFSTLAIIIPASTGTLTGMPRYALLSLGAFILIGKFLEEKPKFKIAFWSLSLVIQSILFSLFITGHWIA